MKKGGLEDWARSHKRNSAEMLRRQRKVEEMQFYEILNEEGEAALIPAIEDGLFTHLTLDDIKGMLIDRGIGVKFILQHLDVLAPEGYTHDDFARDLLEKGRYRSLILDLPHFSFSRLTHDDIALMLLREHDCITWRYLVRNLDRFTLKYVTQSKIAMYFLGDLERSRNNPRSLSDEFVFKILFECTDLSEQVMLRIIEWGVESDIDTLLQHLDNFSISYHDVAVQKIMKKGYVMNLLGHLRKFVFEDFTYDTIAEAAIEQGKGREFLRLVKKHNEFDLFSDTVQEKLMQYMYAESDPYEGHPWYLTKEKRRHAAILGKFLQGKGSSSELERIGVDKETLPFLNELQKATEEAYRIFLSEVSDSKHIPEQDKVMLLHPESLPFSVKPLIEKVQLLIAQYLVVTAAGNRGDFVESVKDTQVEDVLFMVREGFKMYLSVYEDDIRQYDRLYKALDALRKGEASDPVEIFAGRDGESGYVGRRSEDVGRRRSMGPKARREAKSLGKDGAVHPKYVVYPRTFIEGLTDEAKKEYLKQRAGVDEDSNLVIFDTGFVGSVPEDIKKVLTGNPPDPREVQMFSSSQDPRYRVDGLMEDQDDVVERVESIPSREEKAEDLVQEESGEVRHVAKPASPYDQFIFGMVEQAIGRHYYMKGRLGEKSASITPA